ncbi:MAG: hypothetical protein KQI78_17850 [Deltaproteobacteria bacterium]|nr:hypothetical protein [Deltaproteobacteria bacterium]
MLMSSTHNAILVCPLQHDQQIAKTGEVSIAPSLPACFNFAAGRNFSLIIINVPVGREAIRNHVLDLCRGLKRCSETQDTPVIISVEFLNREMTLKMANAGIRFMEVRPKRNPIDPDHLLHMVRRGDPSIRIDLILARLCPFLDHRQVDGGRELTTCKAYRNRMVLGGKRLHKMCESDCHVYCDCFLHPRFAS